MPIQVWVLVVCFITQDGQWLIMHAPEDRPFGTEATCSAAAAALRLKIPEWGIVAGGVACQPFEIIAPQMPVPAPLPQRHIPGKDEARLF